MKKIMTLVLAAGMLFGAATGASAIDFKAKGQWIFGFGAVNSNYTPEINGQKNNMGDNFAAMQRVRLQMDAVASEALSGTVYFEIGDQTWGKASQGGALGADGMVVEVKRAYIDWMVPNTALKVRMGLQGLALPNVAGGSAVFDDDVAAVTASYKFNENVALTAAWARPYNDNFGGDATYPANYLDNVDLFALIMPVTGQGWSVTPWAAVGMQGVNAAANVGKSAANATGGMNSIGFAYGNLIGDAATYSNFRKSSNAYGTGFFAGLPIAITALDPWNFELDMNYGYNSSNGTYSTTNLANGAVKRAENNRQGWLVKGLAEYKLDWGTPGIFAWYGSGDDGDVKNGSERMPNMAPCGNFTSFLGDGAERGWSVWSGGNLGYDQMYSYAGTWGVGLQLKDLSFVENLKHTLRVAYWGGTNSPEMAKYLPSRAATELTNVAGSSEGFYLTTNDYLVEINVDSAWKVYDNLEVVLELGYIVNGIDKGTWDRAYKNDRFEKGDGYKAALIFNYTF